MSNRNKAEENPNETIDVGGLSAEEAGLLQGLRDLAQELEGKDKTDEQKQAEKKEEFPKSELLSIFDSLITQNVYVESCKIGSRMNVVWRTRTAEESNAIAKLIDSAGFNMILTIQNHTNILNMAYSLVAFNGKDYRDAPLAVKHKMLQGLPEVLIIALSESLAKFDYKVAKSVEVGRENF